LIQTLRILNAPCERMTEFISRSMDESIPFTERLAYRLHVLYCTRCRRFRRQMRLLRAVLRECATRVGDLGDMTQPAGASLSPDAKARITAALTRGDPPTDIDQSTTSR
jgi:hypothetical protein